MVYKFIFSLLQDEDEALGVTIKVFLALANALQKPYEINVKSFLMITARHYTLNFLQAKKKSA